MTRFLCAENDDLINADQIHRIEADGERRSKATLINGATVRLFGDLDQIRRLFCPVVAARPGYTALDYYEDAHGEPVVARMPVIAWRLEGYFVTPVTPADNDMLSLNTESTILLPDGQIVQPGDQIFPNEESWREDMAKQAKSRREQEAEQKKPSDPFEREAMTNDIIDAARELHGMRRRMAGKNCDRYPEASGGEVAVLGAQTYAVLVNGAGATVAVYHVSGPPSGRQYMHIELGLAYPTLIYRRRVEDVYGAARP